MAKNSTPSTVRTRRGGWAHPLALLLLVVAVAWAVGAFFTVSDRSFPKIGAIPGLFDLGGWNFAIAAVIALGASSVASRTRPEPEPGTPTGSRFAAPLMIASAVIGLLWIVVFYVISGTDITIPVYSDLGDWNIVIGMGFIVAAFGFAMKWE
ncbi:MAG: cell division protein CrgA [Propionibacteriales bacterium]|nr:cell division protein CrgA [Propionibacteriales bacterium]